MNPLTIIARKRDGQVLSDAEISFFIRGYVADTIPDYQMSALAMAIYLRGMTAAETGALTTEMLHSGSSLTWPEGGLPKVDKHSTGGVGDKVSLILAPLLACCDLQVPMISGRGLGATGGTLDKLESIPGFRTNLDEAEIRRVVDSVGCVITGSTGNLAPADRKLYALRDVTATVASIPLITASIMCKKLAESLDALVLDVKFGSGAFMKTSGEARELAQSMVAVGGKVGLKTSALLTDMNQPLGRQAGNAVEVNESLETLAGEGPDDLRELTLALGAEILLATERESERPAALQRLEGHLDSGRALEKFRQMVAAQGGDLDAPRTIAAETIVTADRDGYIASIDTEALGMAVVEMGGGRKQLGDKIDFSVGLEMLVRLGHAVQEGDPLVRMFAVRDAESAARQIRAAFLIQPEPVTPGRLILETLE